MANSNKGLTLKTNGKFHPDLLAKTLFALPEDELHLDVRIHCSDGQIVRANRQKLSLASLLFREIFGSFCECVTLLPVSYDVLCPDFNSDLMKKVLNSVLTGEPLTQTLDEIEKKEVQSILAALQVVIPFQFIPMHPDENDDESFMPQIEDSYSLADPCKGKEHAFDATEQKQEKIQEDAFQSRGNEMEWSEDQEPDVGTGETGKAGSSGRKDPDNSQGGATRPETRAQWGNLQGAGPQNDSSQEIFNMFKCHICSKSFSQAGGRKTHIETVHLKLKPFKCRYCSHAFGTKGNMKSHVLNKH